MAASEIRLPETDNDVDDYENIDEDQLSQSSASSKCAPVHFVTSHNKTCNATSHIMRFTTQQFSTSTSANLKQSFTTDDLRTKVTQQVSSSADVSRPSSGTGYSPDESYEEIDVGGCYDNIGTGANAIHRSQTSRRIRGAASRHDDGGDYEDIDAIRFRNTNNEQNTSQQLNNENVLQNNFPAPDNTNNFTAHTSSSSHQSASCSSNGNSIADQSESSSPGTAKIRFVQHL